MASLRKKALLKRVSAGILVVLFVSYALGVLLFDGASNSTYTNGTIEVRIKPQHNPWLLNTAALEFELKNTSSKLVQVVEPTVDITLVAIIAKQKGVVSSHCDDTGQCAVYRGWFFTLEPGEKRHFVVPFAEVAKWSKVRLGATDITIRFDDASMNSTAELQEWTERSTMGRIDMDGYRVRKTIFGTMILEDSLT